MNSFTTFNQFDKRFSELDKFGGDRTACPLFGLLTCYNFMLNGDISQKQHEQNIYAAVTNYISNKIPKYMSFDKLLEFTNNSLNVQDINATSPELITSGIISYEHMFKLGYYQNYCILFLKNRNYIAVLFKSYPESESHTGEVYAVRDCHENTQRDFDNLEAVQKYLDNTYQFEQMTIVDGVQIPEFSNIEFITIDTPFELTVIDPNLVDDTLDEEKNFKDSIDSTTTNTTNTINTTNTTVIVPPINNSITQMNNDEFLAYSVNYDDEDNCDNYVDFL